MFFLFKLSREPSIKPKPTKTTAVGGAAGVPRTIPVQGFIINGTSIAPPVATAAVATAAVISPFSAWMRTFLSACAWAFMIAAGSLIYTHFVKKWQTNGLPMLPVSALVAGQTAAQSNQYNGTALPFNQAQPSPSQGGLNSGSFRPAQAPNQSSARPSFMDEYEI